LGKVILRSSEKNRGRTKFRFSILWLCALAIIIILAWSFIRQKSSDLDLEDPNTITISTGTQGRFEDLNIGLVNIQDNSASIYISLKGNDKSTRREVVAGDKFEAYGYLLEIKSIKASFNLSSLVGSSHGYIKLLVSKQ
jgi:hypothetical protein